MYNRYIPQADGSYRRSRHPDKPPAMRPKPKEIISQCQHTEPQETACTGRSADNILSKLLPRSVDTADLLIILMLLLISNDSSEDPGTALLTLALYFLM